MSDRSTLMINLKNQLKDNNLNLEFDPKRPESSKDVFSILKIFFKCLLEFKIWE